MTAETLTSDTPTTDLHHLSERLGAVYGEAEADIAIYEISPLADKPEAKVRLTDGEMWALVEFYLDGCCTVCGNSIPQHHHLCHDCAVNEEQKWHGW